MELFSETGLWIVAVGKTIVHSIWMGLLILALLRLALHHIALKSSSLRYGITVTALLLLLCAVVTAFILIYDPLTAQGKANNIKSVSPALIPFPIASYGNIRLGSSLIFTVFAYLYLAGGMFMLFRSAVSLHYLRGLRKNSIPVDPEWQSRFTMIGRSLGVRRKIELHESLRATGPMLIGLIKPLVIVPAGMIANLPVGQIETILIHELYHLKRRDHLVNIMQLFIEGLLFYNPAVWIISDYIRIEREHCCDDGVLHDIKDPLIYAKALIQVAELQEFTRLAPGAVSTTKQHLSTRIKRILNKKNMRTNMRDRVISLALLALSLVLLLTISSFSKGPYIIRFKEMSPNVMIQDTIPKENKITKEEIEQEIEDAINEARNEIEEIDWEEIEQEIEDAKQEAMKEIEEIDWEEIREDMEKDMESVIAEIEDIDWDQVKVDLDQSMLEMKRNMEEMKREIENSMKEINWDEIEKELEKAKLQMDSLKIELER